MSASSRPQVRVEQVTLEDLDRCSEIFLSAFADDRVMRIVRPSHLHNASLSHAARLSNYSKGLKKHQLDHKGKNVMKAVDQESGEILGVGIWTSPGVPVREKDGKKNEEMVDPIGDDADPEEDTAALKRLVDEMTDKREKLLKHTPHWYLVFLVVDPEAQGKGVGKALLKWGTSQADASEPPLPCYLEASAVGVPVYEKIGFEKVDTCTIYEADAEGNKKEGTEYTWPTMLRPAKQ